MLRCVHAAGRRLDLFARRRAVRGDLDVYLRSPSGRIRWVHKQSKEAAADLQIDNADYSAKFRGQAANGVWQLKMRDAVSGNEASFNSFSVSVSAPGE